MGTTAIFAFIFVVHDPEILARSHGLGLVAAFPLFGDGFGDGFGEASALPASRSLSFQYPNVASLVMTSSKPSSRSSRSAAGVVALGGEGASRGAAFTGVESRTKASSICFGAPPFPSTGASTLRATRATGDAGSAASTDSSSEELSPLEQDCSSSSSAT